LEGNFILKRNPGKMKMQIVIQQYSIRVVYTCLVGIRIGMEPKPGTKIGEE
jgi:hypothetical protein